MDTDGRGLTWVDKVDMNHGLTQMEERSGVGREDEFIVETG